MARILSSLIGDLRGSIGGQTYSRNKAGAFIRQRVKPVNPQTVRQQQARYNFGNMSMIYQSLTTSQKDCWEEFARTHFNPLKGNSTGIYSGGNAFVALRQSARHGNDYRVLPTVTSSVGAVTLTSLNYNEAVEPPTTVSSATLKTTTGDVVEFAITINEVDASGKVDFSLSAPGVAPTSAVQIDELKSAEEDTFGISFYASNNLKFEGSKPNTALKINFADTGILTNIDVEGDALDISQTNNFVVSPNIDKATTRDFPCEGDIILVTPVLRFNKGQQKLMPPTYITVNGIV